MYGTDTAFTKSLLKKKKTIKTGFITGFFIALES